MQKERYEESENNYYIRYLAASHNSFLQNSQAVQTKSRILNVTITRVLMLLVTFVLDFFGGFIIASYVLRKPAKS